MRSNFEDMNLQLSDISLYDKDLSCLPIRKLVINTLNAHCYNLAQKDHIYNSALHNCDVLLPDGVSIVLAKRMLNQISLNKIAGIDLFYYEMERLNATGGKCFFMGSNTETLQRIKERANILYPNVIIHSYAPPYVAKFSEQETKVILQTINSIKPDVLFIGMTAPKQEKWAYENFENIDVGHICNIGAVFDFFAGNIRRAPRWMINLGLEWLFRLYKEPHRLWRRYLIGNFIFLYFIMKEKLKMR
jgi:N-acetylglucosaminyldiphosphoundecaprenol N-acetyl-beta-D-mannosaminyltransferase